MDLKQGEFAVKFARKVIESWTRNGKKLKRPKNIPKEFLEKSGVFTTLYTYPERGLRGCIGLPYPYNPLIDAIIESAISVTRDPRFPELSGRELGKIVVEVSILTKPEKIRVIKPEECLKKIKIGTDGLIIRNGVYSGLLLPQVPKEYGWDARTYLEHLCMKAMLPTGAWKYEGTEIFRFCSEIFGEKKPGGPIERLRN
jgi:uncharacterized protein (TIGR00296 family)